jgi:hypothetical protein
MWSGPRTISTTLLRSWGNRADTAVVDEPFYGCYLAATGKDHPGREDVRAAMDTDWRRVAERLLGPIPGGRAIWYQKHMAHHLLPEMDRGWIGRLDSCLLIRDPRRLLRSLGRVLDAVTLADTGLPPQVHLYRRLADAGRPPIVIDAADILRDPPSALEALCGALDVPYDEAMLTWRPGLRATDGVWAPHWYARVAESTGFGPPEEADDRPLPGHVTALLDDCLDRYAWLHATRVALT